eukprot:8072868-Heterocapsa_arctica.AAC.1
MAGSPSGVADFEAGLLGTLYTQHAHGACAKREPKPADGAAVFALLRYAAHADAVSALLENVLTGCRPPHQIPPLQLQGAVVSPSGRRSVTT